MFSAARPSAQDASLDFAAGRSRRVLRVAGGAHAGLFRVGVRQHASEEGFGREELRQDRIGVNRLFDTGIHVIDASS